MISENTEIKDQTIGQATRNTFKKRRCSGVALDEIRDLQDKIVNYFSDIFPGDKSADLLRQDMIEKLKNHQELRGILYPDDFYEDEQGVVASYELPEDYYLNDYRNIKDIIMDSNMQFSKKLIICLNLAQQFKTIYKRFRDYIVSLSLEAIYVDGESLETYVFMDGLLFSGDGSYTILLSGDSSEYEMVRFLSMISFFLLCGKNPLENRDMKALYPLYTDKTLQHIFMEGNYIYAEETDFRISPLKSIRRMSIEQGIYADIMDFPGFMRDAFQKSFQRDGMDMDTWLNEIRRLRDCLCYSGSGYTFLDAGNPVYKDVLFVCTGNRSYVPIIPYKTVYWYHIRGYLYDRATKGRLAETAENGGLRILTKEKWRLRRSDGYEKAFSKGESTDRLSEGMTLIFQGDGAEEELRIVSGSQIAQKRF